MEYLAGLAFMGMFAVLYAYKCMVDRVCDKWTQKLRERGTK